MLQEQITTLSAWLDQPQYEAGVLHYERLLRPAGVGSDFMLRLLKAGPDPFNRDALTDALTGFRDTLVAKHRAMETAYPPELVGKLERAKDLMNQRTVLKERIRMRFNEGIDGTDEMRGWAYQVLEMGQELDQIYGRRRFFESHGYLPADIDQTETPTEATEGELVSRRNALRTYQSRYRSKLKKVLSTDKRTQYERLLRQYETELDQVQQQLTALTSPPDAFSDR